jgi:hypothetical protein
MYIGIRNFIFIVALAGLLARIAGAAILNGAHARGGIFAAGAVAVLVSGIGFAQKQKKKKKKQKKKKKKKNHRDGAAAIPTTYTHFNRSAGGHQRREGR